MVMSRTPDRHETRAAGLARDAGGGVGARRALRIDARRAARVDSDAGWPRTRGADRTRRGLAGGLFARWRPTACKWPESLPAAKQIRARRWIPPGWAKDTRCGSARVAGSARDAGGGSARDARCGSAQDAGWRGRRKTRAADRRGSRGRRETRGAGRRETRVGGVHALRIGARRGSGSAGGLFARWCPTGC
jgi:hypothetical protein